MADWSNNAWNVFETRPGPVNEQGMAEAYIRQDDRSLPQNWPGWQTRERDRFTYPYPSYLFGSELRLQPCMPVTWDQLEWFAVPAISYGDSRNLDFPSVRQSQYTTEDGLPLNDADAEAAIRNQAELNIANSARKRKEQESAVDNAGSSTLKRARVEGQGLEAAQYSGNQSGGAPASGVRPPPINPADELAALLDEMGRAHGGGEREPSRAPAGGGGGGGMAPAAEAPRRRYSAGDKPKNPENFFEAWQNPRGAEKAAEILNNDAKERERERIASDAVNQAKVDAGLPSGAGKLVNKWDQFYKVAQESFAEYMEGFSDQDIVKEFNRQNDNADIKNALNIPEYYDTSIDSLRETIFTMINDEKNEPFFHENSAAMQKLMKLYLKLEDLEFDQTKNWDEAYIKKASGLLSRVMEPFAKYGREKLKAPAFMEADNPWEKGLDELITMGYKKNAKPWSAEDEITAGKMTLGRENGAFRGARNFGEIVQNYLATKMRLETYLRDKKITYNERRRILSDHMLAYSNPPATMKKPDKYNVYNVAIQGSFNAASA
jgi:hypothetical protein